MERSHQITRDPVLVVAPPRGRQTRLTAMAGLGSGLGMLISGTDKCPEPTAVGPFTARLAEHQAARGDGVTTVLTGLPKYSVWRLLRGAPWCLDERIDRVLANGDSTIMFDRRLPMETASAVPA
jgi:hypothetical protein